MDVNCLFIPAARFRESKPKMFVLRGLTYYHAFHRDGKKND